MANTQLFDNNAVTSLAAGITAIATTMTVQTGEGALFATVASPDTMLLTLDDGAGNIEIVEVTTHTAAADTFTIVRAQEGTTGFAFSTNDPVELRATAGFLQDSIVHSEALATVGLRALNIQPMPGRSAAQGATAQESIAIGYNADATTTQSIAIGKDSKATHNTSVSMGYRAYSGGIEDVAIGHQAGGTNIGLGSTCVGYNAGDAGSSASQIVSIGQDAGASTQSVSIGSKASMYSTSNSKNIVIGYGGANSGYNEKTIGIGYKVSLVGSNANSVIIGAQASCGSYSDNCIQIGYKATVASSGDHVIAIGQQAYSDTAFSQVMNNAPIARDSTLGPAATSADNRIKYLTTSQAILSTNTVDLTALGNFAVTLPTNFFIEELGVICVTLTGLTTQPNISAGTTSGGVDVYASTITTALTAAGKMERVTSPLLDDTAQTADIWFNVATAATATTMTGRFYAKGYFMVF